VKPIAPSAYSELIAKPSIKICSQTIRAPLARQAAGIAWMNDLLE
jgi:hypothetical protein